MSPTAVVCSSEIVPVGRTSNDEEYADKFATLFSPATPHATPTSSPRLYPVQLGTHVSPLAHRAVHGLREWDRGILMPVSAAHDPLSMPSATSPPPTSSLVSSVSTLTSAQAGSEKRTITIAQTASMEFFDKFTEEAKRASELNKRGYLDELLHHEDDPLYWLLPDPSHSPDVLDTGGESSHDTANIATEEITKMDNEAAVVTPAQDTDRPLIDLSFDDLDLDGTGSWDESPESVQGDEEGSRSASENATEQSAQEHGPRPSRPLAQSLTSAPPQPSSAVTTSSHPSRTPSRRSESPSSSTPSTLSQNYNTLSTLSSRWMSTLLSSSRLSAPSTSSDAHRAFDTLFAIEPSPSTKSKTTSQHVLFATSSAGHTHRPPVNINTVPIPRTRNVHNVHPSMVSMSHNTPFGSHMSSFTPPSGAPGFSGDDHAWDRGFSEDYDREKVERRSISLRGRQEGDGSVGVLEVGLADLVSSCLLDFPTDKHRHTQS
jgi:hypothetical protein